MDIPKDILIYIFETYLPGTLNKVILSLVFKKWHKCLKKKKYSKNLIEDFIDTNIVTTKLFHFFKKKKLLHPKHFNDLLGGIVPFQKTLFNQHHDTINIYGYLKKENHIGLEFIQKKTFHFVNSSCFIKNLEIFKKAYTFSKEKLKTHLIESSISSKNKEIITWLYEEHQIQTLKEIYKEIQSSDTIERFLSLYKQYADPEVKKNILQELSLLPKIPPVVIEYAVVNNDENILKLLLKMGPSFLFNVLEVAVKKKNIDLVKRIQPECYMTINIVYTSLEHDDDEITKYLIEYFSTVHATSMYERTIYHENLNIIKFLETKYPVTNEILNYSIINSYEITKHFMKSPHLNYAIQELILVYYSLNEVKKYITSQDSNKEIFQKAIDRGNHEILCYLINIKYFFDIDAYFIIMKSKYVMKYVELLLKNDYPYDHSVVEHAKPLLDERLDKLFKKTLQT